MLGRERHDTVAYRGPERRDPDRVPPPLRLEDPPGQFWWRAALVAPTVAAGVLAAAVLTAQGFDEVRTVHASLRLCWCIIALGAGAGFFLRWRLTGEAPIALLGAALLVFALPQLPFALADLAGDPDATWRRLGPTTRMTVMVPTAWLLLCCIRSPQVDSALRPGQLVLGYSAAATAAAGALTAGQALDLLGPASPAVRSITGGMLGGLLLMFAVLIARRARSVESAVGIRVGVALAGLGLACLVNVSWRVWPPLALLGEFTAVIFAVVLLLVPVALLRSAVDFYGLRMMSLRQEADSAGDAVRREQERMHEVRATVAGIRQASGTLSRYAHRLDPNREHDLQQMMAAELGRLERLLTSDWRVPLPGPVMLDEVIRPVVTSHREQGATVSWRPTGRCAVAHGDAAAEVLSILLTNVGVHAPGAAVEVTVVEDAAVVRVLVRDDGPGVSPEVRAQAFDRGVRREGSPGHGLGLHVARDLAVQSGGGLDLLPADAAGGTTFALTLPAVSDPTSARPAGSPLEESA